MQESHGLSVGGLATDFRAFRRSAFKESLLQDHEADQLAARVTAIEEVFAARWPRRWLLAGRLRRVLRASTRHIVYGGTFAERRAETASLLVHPGDAPVGDAPEGAE